MAAEKDEGSSTHLHFGTGIFTRKTSFFGSRIKEKIRDTDTDTNNNSIVSKSQSRSQSNTPPASPSSNSNYTGGHLPTTPPRRRAASSRHSISHSVTDFGTNLRRSASLLSSNTSHSASSSSHKKTPSTATLALSFSPEKVQNVPNPQSRPALSISTFTRNKKSTENVKSGTENGVGGGGGVGYNKSPLSAVDHPKTPFGGMAVSMPLRHPPSQKEIRQAQQQNPNPYGAGLGPAAPLQIGGSNGSHNPNIIFQHIHDMASKRISTLDYLRKAHEGRIYWFNTLLFSKPDLARLPYFDPRRLSRRATNYLLLGFSLPTILDLNANSPTDYLRALNALLVEFETYQNIHPPDGTPGSSLSRGKMGQMFKRATAAAGGKGRRSSSAASDLISLNEPASAIDPPASFSPPNEPPTTSGDPLLPGEEYTHLLTPSLPFEPDFFETFATLCDVLIDCYTKVMTLISSPEQLVTAGGGVPSTVGDLFAKADARVRKIILAGIVREFEDTSRSGVKGEVAGVGKVVLGGLM